MLEEIREIWTDALEIKEARWIVAFFGLVTCILVGVYVVKKFRDMALGGGTETISHLTEFQRLHEAGKLNQDEYDRLKKTIPKNITASVVPGSTKELPGLAAAERKSGLKQSKDNQ